MRRYFGDLLLAGTAATLFSGLPSTLYAFVRHEDISEATRAAGAMLISPASSLLQLFEAAAVVHVAVSFFWAALLVRFLPRRHVVAGAVAAAIAIGIVDLRVIAPLLFPEVARLAFWPQMADHVMWGLCLGLALAWRARKIA
ncbi:MAG TPA: hypothetical protein VHP37_20050 [Burkholderiales bacterium]|nr:hypothetical protein [Burkholderiales bacterium]